MSYTQVTSHDVAREAQVSQATVSRALRGDARISARTAAKVQAIADRMGYIPSSVGRSLSSRATLQVAVVAELGNQTYPETLPTLHDELAALGYRMLLISERPDEEIGHEILFDGSVDGVILMTSRVDDRLPHRLRERNIPFVFLNRVAKGVEADSVTVDNAGGARAVAELLLGHGHRNIAMLSGPTNISSAAARERAFTAALREAGIDRSMRPVIRRELNFEAGEQGYADLMPSRHPPTAIFCAADAVAVGLINAVTQHAGNRPQPAIVGFDNSPMACWPVFSLTTVETDLPGLTRQAVHLLINRLKQPLDGRDVPVRKIVVPAALVLRKSHLAAADPGSSRRRER